MEEAQRGISVSSGEEIKVVAIPVVEWVMPEPMAAPPRQRFPLRRRKRLWLLGCAEKIWTRVLESIDSV